MKEFKENENHRLLLAIDPFSRGFGYALFEGPLKIVDWGITENRLNVSKRSYERIEQILDFYHPHILVLEDHKGDTSRKCKRIKKLIERISKLAKAKEIEVKIVTPKKVHEVFDEFNCKNKHDMELAICEWHPALSSRKPPKRAIWMSEDPRTNLFDAAAFALTYYYSTE